MGLKWIAVIILVLLVPVGLILLGLAFHPAALILVMAVIIWVAAVSGLIILLVEDLQEQIKKQENETSELRALCTQRRSPG
jgi:hypothetical protein